MDIKIYKHLIKDEFGLLKVVNRRFHEGQGRWNQEELLEDPQRVFRWLTVLVPL